MPKYQFDNRIIDDLSFKEPYTHKFHKTLIFFFPLKGQPIQNHKVWYSFNGQEEYFMAEL